MKGEKRRKGKEERSGNGQKEERTNTDKRKGEGCTYTGMYIYRYIPGDKNNLSLTLAESQLKAGRQARRKKGKKEDKCMVKPCDWMNETPLSKGIYAYNAYIDMFI